MSLSTKLYEQALLVKKPTESTLPVLDLISSSFKVRVITFEPLVAQLPSFASS